MRRGCNSRATSPGRCCRPGPAREPRDGLRAGGELKFGQVGIANLRVRTLDVAQLAAEMRDRVQRAPNLFDRTAVVLDFGGLSAAPSLADARALVDGLRAAGVLPVALAYGTREIDALSRELGLPLLAKFRAQYERADAAPAAPRRNPRHRARRNPPRRPNPRRQRPARG